jgi:hypothetical protein
LCPRRAQILAFGLSFFLALFLVNTIPDDEPRTPESVSFGAQKTKRLLGGHHGFRIENSPFDQVAKTGSGQT